MRPFSDKAYVSPGSSLCKSKLFRLFVFSTAWVNYACRGTRRLRAEKPESRSEKCGKWKTELSGVIIAQGHFYFILKMWWKQTEITKRNTGGWILRNLMTLGVFFILFFLCSFWINVLNVTSYQQKYPAICKIQKLHTITCFHPLF